MISPLSWCLAEIRNLLIESYELMVKQERPNTHTLNIGRRLFDLIPYYRIPRLRCTGAEYERGDGVALYDDAPPADERDARLVADGFTLCEERRGGLLSTLLLRAPTLLNEGKGLFDVCNSRETGRAEPADLREGSRAMEERWAEVVTFPER